MSSTCLFIKIQKNNNYCISFSCYNNNTKLGVFLIIIIVIVKKVIATYIFYL